MEDSKAGSLKDKDELEDLRNHPLAKRLLELLRTQGEERVEQLLDELEQRK